MKIKAVCTKNLKTIRKEKNDCAVRALAVAAGITYDEAHGLLAKCGRRIGRRSSFDAMHEAYTEMGGVMKAIFGKTISAKCLAMNHPDVPTTDGIILSRLLEELPKGRFVCVMRGHAFAIVNNQVYNEGGSIEGNTRIAAIYRF